MTPVEIYVYSREAIQAIPPHEEAQHLIISINTTPADADAVRPSRCRSTVGMHFTIFGDVDVSSVVPRMTEEQARDIWEFIAEHRAKITRILVHCDGGRSRSPGVAAAIAACLNRDDKEFFARYTPNMHVYRTMMNTFTDGYEGHSTT